MIIPIYKDWQNSSDIEGYAKLITFTGKVITWEHKAFEKKSIIHYAEKWVVLFVDPEKHNIYPEFKNWWKYKAQEGFRTTRFINKGFHSFIIEEEE